MADHPDKGARGHPITEDRILRRFLNRFPAKDGGAIRDALMLHGIRSLMNDRSFADIDEATILGAAANARTFIDHVHVRRPSKTALRTRQPPPKVQRRPVDLTSQPRADVLQEWPFLDPLGTIDKVLTGEAAEEKAAAFGEQKDAGSAAAVHFETVAAAAEPDAPAAPAPAPAPVSAPAPAPAPVPAPAPTPAAASPRGGGAVLFCDLMDRERSRITERTFREFSIGSASGIRVDMLRDAMIALVGEESFARLPLSELLPAPLADWAAYAPLPQEILEEPRISLLQWHAISNIFARCIRQGFSARPPAPPRAAAPPPPPPAAEAEPAEREAPESAAEDAEGAEVAALDAPAAAAAPPSPPSHAPTASAAARRRAAELSRRRRLSKASKARGFRPAASVTADAAVRPLGLSLARPDARGPRRVPRHLRKVESRIASLVRSDREHRFATRAERRKTVEAFVAKERLKALGGAAAAAPPRGGGRGYDFSFEVLAPERPAPRGAPGALRGEAAREIAEAFLAGGGLDEVLREGFDPVAAAADDLEELSGSGGATDEAVLELRGDLREQWLGDYGPDHTHDVDPRDKGGAGWDWDGVVYAKSRRDGDTRAELSLPSSDDAVVDAYLAGAGPGGPEDLSRDLGSAGGALAAAEDDLDATYAATTASYTAAELDEDDIRAAELDEDEAAIRRAFREAIRNSEAAAAQARVEGLNSDGDRASSPAATNSSFEVAEAAAEAAAAVLDGAGAARPTEDDIAAAQATEAAAASAEASAEAAAALRVMVEQQSVASSTDSAALEAALGVPRD